MHERNKTLKNHAKSMHESELANFPTTSLSPENCPRVSGTYATAATAFVRALKDQLFNQQRHNLGKACEATILVRQRHGLPPRKVGPQRRHRPHGDALLGPGAKLHDAGQPQGGEDGLSSLHFYLIL